MGDNQLRGEVPMKYVRAEIVRYYTVNFTVRVCNFAGGIKFSQ